MCTVTWFRESGGFQLFFNRDERRTRRPALPPEVHRRGGVRFISPIDADAGGTWIAVNERGLALGLLNGYVEPQAGGATAPDGFTSRGVLPATLIDSPSARQVVERLGGMELSRFRSFLLLAIEPAGPSLLARWNGGALSVDERADSSMPLISSSFDPNRVGRSRRALFLELSRAAADRAAAHVAFHESHRPERGPCSPCMHRGDARTVSFSRILVDADTVRLSYAPHSPCRGRPGPPLSLRRSAATVSTSNGSAPGPAGSPDRSSTNR